MKNSRKKNRAYLITAVAVLAALLIILLAALIWLELGSGANPNDIGTPTQSSAETTSPTTGSPTEVPTTDFVTEPTEAPTAEQTTESTVHPTTEPATQPTTEPTVAPTTEPTTQPTAEPTEAPPTEPTAEPTTEPTEAPTVEPTTEPEDNVLYGTGTVDTPYLTLYYDDAFADHVKIVIAADVPYTVEFYACLDGIEEQHLFTIVMGEGANGNLGIIETDVGETPVSIVFCEIDRDAGWTDDAFNTILAMQDAANDLIDQLMMHRVQDGPSDPSLPTEGPDQPEYTEIETPYCTLSYPAAWQAYLRVEREETDADYRVLFFGQLENREPVLLFTIIFGGDSGEQMGALIGDGGQIIPVNIDMKELDLSGYAGGDAEILYSMQEAANQLISELPLA